MIIGPLDDHTFTEIPDQVAQRIRESTNTDFYTT